MAELTLRAVIKWYPMKNISKNSVFVLFLPHVFLQVGIKQVIRYAMHTPVSITGIKRETQDLYIGPRL